MGLEEEEQQVRSVALQNARSILEARQRSEQELVEAKEALERKTEELDRSLSAMRATLESTTDGIVVTDNDRNVTTFNKRYAEMWGVPDDAPLATFEDLLAQSSYLFNEPEKRIGRVRSIYDAQSEESYDLLSLRDGRRIERFSRIQRVGDEVIGRVWSFRDITEQQRTEEVKAYLGAVIENSEDAIVSKDLNGIVTTWNRAAERVFGYTAEEMVGTPIAILIPPELNLGEPEILARIRRGERIEHFETERVRKDGKRIQISLSVSPIRDAHGTIIGASKIARDITKQKQVERDLEEETRILELLNQTGTAFAGHLDLKTLVQTVTDASTEIVGAKFGAFFYNCENEEGESYVLYTLTGAPREAFEPFGLPRNTPIFEPTFRGKGVLRSPDITKDSRYGKVAPHFGMPKEHLPVRSYLAVPVVSGNGTVIGGLFYGHPDADVFTERSERVIQGIAAQAAIAIDNARLFEAAQREIEERQRVEEALRESQAQLQATFNQAAVGIAIAGPDGRFVQVNDQFCTILGYDSDELMSISFRALTHPDDLEETESQMERLLSGEAANYSLEKRYLTKTGGVIWSLTSVTIIRGADGEPVRFIGVIEDITSRKQAEDERKLLLESERAARVEAEKLGRLKDEFLATLSHELRTPLTSILGWSHLIQADVTNEDRVREGVEIIERNARLQTQLVEDLLDMNRILSGKMRLDVQQVDLPEVITAAIESMRPAAEAKGLRIETMLDPITEIINGDPARLQQIIWNLVSNAVKFTPRGGKLQVMLHRVNSHVEITVADTGKGIHPDFLPHIFERFRQEDATSARHHGGLGIGLAIAKQLVDLHGGKIRVASGGDGAGATFIVELPISAAYRPFDLNSNRQHPGASAGIPVDVDIPDLTDVLVLVVDDEQDARDLLCLLLEDRGATVIAGGSAAEALSILENTVPDVLISDIGMPGLDGYALIREVRRRGITIPAAAITAFARSEDRTRALLAGYHAHIPKPVEPFELLATVASLAKRTSKHPEP